VDFAILGSDQVLSARPNNSDLNTEAANGNQATRAANIGYKPAMGGIRMNTWELSTKVFWLVAGVLVTACDNKVRFGGSANGLPGGPGGVAGAGGDAGMGGVGATGGGGAGGSAGQGGGCINGATQPCYSANPATIGVGQCLAGTATCAAGQWSTCVGEVVPAGETCNGVDDDCNGQTDDGNPGGGANCTVSGELGECAKGTSTCVAGMLGCPQSIMPISEVCNDGKDNDCNGTVDNGCSSSACNINGAALPFPIALPAGAAFGTLTFDGNCDIITPGGSTGQIFRINKNTGAVTTLVSTPFNGVVNGVVYRPADNLIYATVNNPSGLFSIPMTGGPATLVIQPKWMLAPAKVLDIVVTPPPFLPPYLNKGQFIGGGVDGHVYGVLTSTDNLDYFDYIASYPIKTLVFSPDGNALYLAQSQTSSIHRRKSDGSGTVLGWASNLNWVNGMAMDTDGSRLWVTHSDFLGQEHVISSIDIASGVQTIVTKAIPFSTGNFNSEITGIVADADDEVFVKSWDGTNARIVKVP
jgi:hypothetical protein